MFRNAMRRAGGAAALALLAAALLAADPASAFWKRKPKDPATRPARAADRDLYAPMVFCRGVLRGGEGGWRLDDLPLVAGAGAVVDAPGGRLAAGREAVVTGWLRAGRLVAHHVSVLEPDRSLARGLTSARDVGGAPRLAPADAPR